MTLITRSVLQEKRSKGSEGGDVDIEQIYESVSGEMQMGQER
jgi:hypothetical protein